MKILQILSSLLVFAMLAKGKLEGKEKELKKLLNKLIPNEEEANQNYLEMLVTSIENGRAPVNIDMWIKQVKTRLSGDQRARRRNSVPIDLSDLFKYACWCNMAGSLLTGQGEPLDKFDEACKAMQLCFQCATIDNKNAETPEDPCHPAVNTFTIPFFWPTTKEQDCAAFNSGSQCNSNFCHCNAIWTETVLNLGVEGETIKPAFQQDSENFDYDSQCATTPTTTQEAFFGENINSCCGSYPEIVPSGGTEQCCGPEGQSFNPLEQVCCPTGLVNTTVTDPHPQPEKHEFQKRMLDQSKQLKVFAADCDHPDQGGYTKCFSIKPFEKNDGAIVYYNKNAKIVVEDCDSSSQFQKWDYDDSTKFISQTDELGIDWCWTAGDDEISWLKCTATLDGGFSREFSYTNGQIKIEFGDAQEKVVAWLVDEDDGAAGISYIDNQVTGFGTASIKEKL